MNGQLIMYRLALFKFHAVEASQVLHRQINWMLTRGGCGSIGLEIWG